MPANRYPDRIVSRPGTLLEKADAKYTLSRLTREGCTSVKIYKGETVRLEVRLNDLGKVFIRSTDGSEEHNNLEEFRVAYGL